MPKDLLRPRRVADAIQRILSELIRREVKDHRGGSEQRSLTRQSLSQQLGRSGAPARSAGRFDSSGWIFASAIGQTTDHI